MGEFVDRGVDGIIMFSGCLSDAAVRRFARRVPIVVAGRSLRGPRVFSLPVNDREGARIAVKHLISGGHRRIAFIAGTQDHPDGLERLAGYQAALAQAGIPFDPRLVAAGDWHEGGGLQATERLLDSGQRFSAIFCVNDQSAHGAYLALFRRGLRVPQDVSVVGFDDLPASAYVLPPLTSIRQSVFELGERSAEAILAILAGHRPKVEPPEIKLILRESTRAL